ncbi:hypothetical protein GCM10007874_68980 [Labrys miyagiensis]|uniref:Uncharacterized protein n=1 Tax=Labrys miyagiensis TaxID=346912 RepID=A0ABQ6CZZ1_9HYPH|nr:hypothetical protein [Labrys miyagiensis]GLS23877.1 hypothetical protein GCM10007874_68980 [Labrys miyagiensis]
MVQRGSRSSIIPMLGDTGLTTMGIDPFFDTRSSGTNSGFLASPSLDLLYSAQGAVGGIARAAREGGYSQGEARRLARVLPFQNMFPLVPLLNSLISGQPEKVSQH